MAEKSICISCRRPKASLSCEICFEPVCKSCERFLEASTFSFFETLPEELSHTHYCSLCYDSHVAPAFDSYSEIMERARGLYFFFDTQRKMIPVLKTSKENVRVESCNDRDETILRLGFLAAQQGYNAVTEAKVVCEKVRNAGYQKSKWQGVGIPAQVDAEKLERNLSRE